MKINELPIDSNVLIKAKKGLNQIEFTTQIVTPLSKFREQFGYGCIVKVIKHKDIAVNFSNTNVIAVISNPEDDRDYEFSLTACALCKVKNESYHVLYSLKEAQASNRRGTFRVECLYEAVIQLGEYRQTIDGYVRDLSSTGIGLTVLHEYDYSKIGDVLSISFLVRDRRFKVEAMVVRKNEEFNEERTLLGCKFVEEYQDIQDLVYKLQIVQRAKLRNKMEHEEQEMIEQEKEQKISKAKELEEQFDKNSILKEKLNSILDENDK